MDVKEIGQLGDAMDQHWYYASKARALEGLLDGIPHQTLWDIGAGDGFFAKHLLQNSALRSAVCVDTAYEHDRIETSAGKPLQFLQSLPKGTTDAVLLMDVLEHVEDEAEILEPLRARVPKNTPVIVSVPAFQCLWSGHDVYLEHFRRYTRRTLIDRLATHGLVAERVHYFYGAVLPIAATLRACERLMRRKTVAESRLRTHAPWVNAVLKAVCLAEAKIMQHNTVAGLSVMGMFRTT